MVACAATVQAQGGGYKVDYTNWTGGTTALASRMRTAVQTSANTAGGNVAFSAANDLWLFGEYIRQGYVLVNAKMNLHGSLSRTAKQEDSGHFRTQQ
ncbi:MAG: hypothetical protein ACI8X5_003044 [Planctomycetota bacterium]|jgi:hypothetical protein